MMGNQQHGFLQYLGAFSPAGAIDTLNIYIFLSYLSYISSPFWFFSPLYSKEDARMMDENRKIFRGKVKKKEWHTWNMFNFLLSIERMKEARQELWRSVSSYIWKHHCTKDHEHTCHHQSFFVYLWNSFLSHSQTPFPQVTPALFNYRFVCTFCHFTLMI